MDHVTAQSPVALTCGSSPSGLARVRTVALLAALIALVVLPGCGQIRGKVTTTLHRDLTLSRTTDLYLSGLLATMWSRDGGGGMTLPGTSDGGQIATAWEDDELHITHTLEKVPLETLASDAGAGEFSVSKRYLLVATLYEYKQSVTQNSFTGAPEGQLPGVKVEFALNMPGRIISSSSDSTDGGSALWALGPETSASGVSMKATSLAFNLYETIGVGVLLILMLAWPSRRKSKP